LRTRSRSRLTSQISDGGFCVIRDFHCVPHCYDVKDPTDGNRHKIWARSGRSWTRMLPEARSNSSAGHGQGGRDARLLSRQLSALRMPGRSTTEGTPAVEDDTGHELDAEANSSAVQRIASLVIRGCTTPGRNRVWGEMRSPGAAHGDVLQYARLLTHSPKKPLFRRWIRWGAAVRGANTGRRAGSHHRRMHWSRIVCRRCDSFLEP